MYKVIIESPDGTVIVGRGTDMFKAYTDAVSNFKLIDMPKKGPGMWEIDPSERPSNKGKSK